MIDFRGKRILVTGADGFIGSHLVDTLLDKGALVKALVWYHPQQDWGWMNGIVNPNLTIVAGDIRDAGSCMKWVAETDIVFHLAALIGIPYSYESPDAYVATNVNGTLNLLEACRLHQSSMIFMSTSEVYGTARQVPISESHPLQSQSPYSASKIGAEALVRSYFAAFDLPVVVARTFNTYGPRQSTRAILPTIITQLGKGTDSLVLGDLSPTRDMVFVQDTCEALCRLPGVDALLGQAVNICTGQEVSMKKLVNIVQEMMHTKVPVVQDAQRVRPQKSEVKRLCGDNSLLRQHTGFQPATSLEHGLKQTIPWFIQHLDQGGYLPTHYHV